MRWALLGCVLAMVIGGEAQAEPGAWQVEAKTSALDNSSEYEAVLQSNETLTNILGRDEHAALLVDCGRQGFGLSISWPDFVEKQDVEDLNVTVVWRVDDGTVQKSGWIATTKAAGQLGNKALSTLKAWSLGHKVIVRVPDQHGGQDASFNVDGIDQIYAHVSQTGCG